MKFLPLARLLFPLLVTAVGPAVQAQPIQPGWWEFRVDLRTPDHPEDAAGLKDLGESLRRGYTEPGLYSPDGQWRRTCIRGRQPRAEPLLEGAESGCRYSDVRRRGNTWQGRVSCDDRKVGDAGMFGTYTLVQTGRTHYVADVRMVSRSSGRIDVHTEARRIGARCGGRPR